MNRIKKLLLHLKKALQMTWYTSFYYRAKIKKNWILLQSKNGLDLAGNMLRIAEELGQNQDYQRYRLFIAYKRGRRQQFKKIIQLYKIRNVCLIKVGGILYICITAMAGYLFNDSTFPLWFAKKKGQIITNTWHGTPWKKMGKDVPDRAYDMGNVQKNHLFSDYLVYPSDYMRDIMMSAYCLEHLYQGKILLSGYPRNSIFFDEISRSKLGMELNPDRRRLYGYMPTWRGNLRNIHSNKITLQIEYYFSFLDILLQDNEIFYVHLHPFLSDNIDYDNYHHIKPFPKYYQPYDILNICDCLVTDYSSVLFDFSNTGKKIVLFVYDKEIYLKERGIYQPMESFPFSQVRSVEELVKEMRSPKQYNDLEFRNRFCQYDGKDIAMKLCRHIIKGDEVFKEWESRNNGKENVLLYSGPFIQNGLTTALLNLLSNIDLKKRNYYVTFTASSLKENPLRVSMLPKQVGIVPMASLGWKSVGEWCAAYLYYNKSVNSHNILKILDRFYQRLYENNFGISQYRAVVHFTGYEKDIINLFLQADVTRMICVHNDMASEIKTRGFQHELSLKRAYREYDRVLPVTEDIHPLTVELSGMEENIRIMENCHDYKTVLQKAKEEIVFDENTVCTVSVERLIDILSSDVRKFITIGRYEIQKGHKMLLDAFSKFYEEHQESYLFIIGGHGALYEQTVRYKNTLYAKDHIVLICSLRNPMPILKKCDVFILSSLYEGLGLVLLEADTLGIPVISTDIPGPRGFIRDHGGYLAAASAEGIYEGMVAFENGKVEAMNVDYEAYNRNSVMQFERLFQDETKEG